METARLWFDFKGRMNRGKYWFVTLANILIGAAAILIAVAAQSWALGVLAGLIFIPIIISGFAVAVKRLHDREKSAWWLLVFYVAPSVIQGLGAQLHAGPIFVLIAFAISIWAFVELGCLRGTAGPNQYGADPLAGAEPALAH